MARTKIYYKWDIPSGVVNVVCAICADYERRERAIKFSTITGETLARYIELNNAVDRAMEEIETGIRRQILRDIAQGKGFNRSEVQFVMAKNTYYRRRRKMIHDIAYDLSLL